MKKVIHEEKLICDVCKKEVERLKEHYVIGGHYTPSDFQGLANFSSFKDYKIEMCEKCEKKLEEVIRKHFASVKDCDYYPNVDVDEVEEAL